MTDRPIAGILAALAASMFVAAFAAAAVLRPDSAPPAAGATERTAPAAAQEDMRMATIATPSLSRVAALPALHLPKHKKARKTANRAIKNARGMKGICYGCAMATSNVAEAVRLPTSYKRTQ